MRALRRHRSVAAALVAAVMLTLVLAAAPAPAEAKPPWGYAGPPPFVLGGKLGLGQLARLDWLFPDLEEASWALPYVAEMKLRGILKGAGGKFLPNKPASRLETVITAVRLRGGEEAARAMAEAVLAGATTPGQQQQAFRTYVASQYGLAVAGALGSLPVWACGYVLVALEEGLIQATDDLDLGRNATRLEVAVLLVRALGLEPAAQARAGQAAPFVDGHLIPAELAGYVLVAVEQGLVTGMPDHAFQPRRPITRAELAAVLARAGGGLPATGALEVRGTLVSVATTGSGDQITASVTVRRTDGTEASYPVSPSAVVFLSNRPAALSDLRPGDGVRLFLNAQGQVQLIKATKATVVREGVVVSLTTDNGSRRLTLRDVAGSDTTYTVAADVQVVRNDQPATYDAVAVGERVKLTVERDLVVRIEIVVMTSTVRGSVLATATNAFGHPASITIRPEDGQEATYSVSPTVQVTLAGQPVPFSEVRAEDVATLTFEGALVTAIALDARPQSVTGTVVETHTNAFGHPASVRLRLAGGSEASYPVSPTVEVTLAGNPATFASIRVGDSVTLALSGGTAVKIAIVERVVAAGGRVVRTEFNAYGHPSGITLRDAAGAETAYPVSPTVQTFHDDQPMSFADLRVDDTVEVRLEDGTVTRVTVLERVEYRAGTVVATGTNAFGHPSGITLRADGVQTAYPVSPTVQVTHDGQAEAFGSLAFGDLVEVRLDGSTVTAVRILSRAETFDGTVQALDATNLTVAVAVTVTGSDGSQAVAVRTVHVTSDTTVLRGSDLRAFADLAVGQAVTVVAYQEPGGDRLPAVKIVIH